MPGYVIVSSSVKDPERFKEYGERAPATVAMYGGRYLVRGSAHESVEGDWMPERLTVIEFPSVEDARRWHDSEEYRPLRELRAPIAEFNVLIAEAFEG